MRSRVVSSIMPRWLLISILRFLDDDTQTAWHLIEAVEYSDPLNDDAIAFFLIE